MLSTKPSIVDIGVIPPSDVATEMEYTKVVVAEETANGGGKSLAEAILEDACSGNVSQDPSNNNNHILDISPKLVSAAEMMNEQMMEEPL